MNGTCHSDKEGSLEILSTAPLFSYFLNKDKKPSFMFYKTNAVESSTWQIKHLSVCISVYLEPVYF